MATRTALSPSLANLQGSIAGTGGYVGFTGTAGAPLGNGDTLNVPSGSATWSNQLEIPAGLEVIGASKVDSTIGNLVDANAYPGGGYSAATDLTNITRDGANGGKSLILNAENGKLTRFSGFTFLKGSSTSQQGGIHVVGYAVNSATSGVRIDHCHLANMNAADWLHTFGCVFGVMDHCLIEMQASKLCVIWHSTYQEASGARINGEGSWADDANWGTYKFWFFEDCIFRGIDLTTNTAPGQLGGFDGKQGGRAVLRHCRIFDSTGSYYHGTESSAGNEAERGGRAWECYENVFHRTQGASALGQMRSGNILFHDNDFYGTKPNSGCGLTLYRENEAWGGFGGVTGNNPWDRNDTTGGPLGDGLYAHGTAKFAAGTGGAGDVILTDSGSPGWAIDQWKGYFLINLDQGANTDSTNAGLIRKGLSYNSGRIKGNTGSTITTFGEGTTTFQPVLIWKVGNHYEIRKCISALDQSGRGKGAYISYAAHVNAGNTLGGTSVGVNQIVEPSYSWNNFHHGTTVTQLHVQSAYPTIQLNRDYYNRAPQSGDPANSYPYSPYTYPHPMVSGSITPTITSADTTTFTVGSAGSFQMTGSDFSGSITWSKTGSLPSGVTLNSSGLLSGTPAGGTDSGSPYTVTVHATDGTTTINQSFSLVVVASATRIIGLSGSLAFGIIEAGATAQKKLTITNSGNADLTVSSITFPAKFTGDWSSGSISAGASQDVNVTFAPLVAGTTYSGTVTVASDKTSGTNTTSASGTGASRVITLSGDLSFGTITVGQMATRALTVTNDGNSTMAVTSVSYPQGFSGDYASGSIAAGASVTVHVTFSPTAAQGYSGNVSFLTNKTSGTSTFAATGTGSAAATKIIQITGSLAFGSVLDGTTLTKAISIKNSGNTTLTVTDLTVPSGYASDWTAGTIAAGASQTANITFSPIAATTYNGTLDVTSDATGGIASATITGTGTAATTKIIALTGSMVFGNVAIGSTVTRTLTITNSGTAVLTVSSITLPTGFTGSFAGTIDPGASQAVNITFTPLLAQLYSGTITVASDKTNGTNTVSASGTGVVPVTRVISLSGDLAFGNIQKNHTGKRTFVIANTGTGVLNVTNITCPTGFSTDITTATIPAGTSQSVIVTFAPTAAQSYGGSITVLSNETSGVNTIGCSGTGTNKKSVPFFLIVG